MTTQAIRWLREPIAWLVLGIPVATLIAGYWMLRIAASDSATDTAPEKVRRTAQVQVSDLAADEAAARMGLSAILTHTSEASTLMLSGVDDGVELWLDFIHPLESDRDVRLALLPINANLWSGAAAPDAGIAWHVRVSPSDGSWRLVGRSEAGRTETTLQPAIGRP